MPAFRDLWDEEITAKLISLNRKFEDCRVAIDQARKTIATEIDSPWAAILRDRCESHLAMMAECNLATLTLLRLRERRV